ncbi:hypothetical protein [Arthrobacter sp. CG_A4]|uniref:hypothetical protein n=1 Tax=Arthrobacter sp. CG_A4 TaxID=3071706 RepID=UPI002E02BE25|nr:hypothetical protein [Arthrobacter sp. CG_A4]
MEIIAAGLMVSLTLIVIASRGQGKDASILWASVLISVSMVLNINPVYLLADVWVGGRNYADLGANLLLLTGVYFLARAIHRAAQPASYGRKSSYDVSAKAGLAGAATSATILFILIDAPVTSTSFMRDYGGQLTAGLYSAVQYLYIGAVMAAAGWTCTRFRKAWTTGIYTTSFALVGLGCLSAVLLVIDVLVLDALHVLGDVEAMSALSGIYAVLNSATFLFLCNGMALPPAGRKIAAVYETARTSSILAGLKPVWGQAVAGNAGLTLDLGVVPERPDRRRRELHRMIVEIQDSLARDPEASDRVGNEGLEILANASDHLERLSWRPR